MERKLFGLEQIEVKFDGARPGVFSGYASVWDGVDSYGDTIARGAYTKTIGQRERPIQMRWNHRGPVIGKWLTMREDEKGLFVEGELTPGHSVAQDAYALLKHGAVNGLSIGFRPVNSEKTGDDTRLLKEIELVEISIVETPADASALIGDVKSALEEAQSLKDLEAFLRDACGLSRNDVKTFSSRFKDVMQRDVASKNVPEIKTSLAFAFAHIPPLIN